MEQTLRILVVDDSQDSADTVAMLLETKGHVASAVYDADAAIAHMRQEGADVAILDLELPDMSGYELAQELRKLAQRPLLVVALTGHAIDDDEGLRSKGFDHHLLKPLDVDKLGGILEAFQHT